MDWVARIVEAKVLAPSRELSAGYLVRTSEGELMNTPCTYQDLEHTDPASFQIPLDKAKDGTPALNPSHRLRRKTALGAKRRDPTDPAEKVASIRDGTIEDEQAWRLASAEHLDLDKASKFVATSCWASHCSKKALEQLCRESDSVRVVGLFEDQGQARITADLHRFPGFSSLLARIVREVAPKQKFTTLALIRKEAVEARPEIVRRPTSSFIVPLQVPVKGGGFWVEDATGGEVRPGLEGMQVQGRVQQFRPLQPVFLDQSKRYALRDWEQGQQVLLLAYNFQMVVQTADVLIHQVLSNVGFPVSTAGLQQGGDPPNTVFQSDVVFQGTSGVEAVSPKEADYATAVRKGHKKGVGGAESLVEVCKTGGAVAERAGPSGTRTCVACLQDVVGLCSVCERDTTNYDDSQRSILVGGASQLRKDGCDSFMPGGAREVSRLGPITVGAGDLASESDGKDTSFGTRVGVVQGWLQEGHSRIHEDFWGDQEDRQSAVLLSGASEEGDPRIREDFWRDQEDGQSTVLLSGAPGTTDVQLADGCRSDGWDGPGIRNDPRLSVWSVGCGDSPLDEDAQQLALKALYARECKVVGGTCVHPEEESFLSDLNWSICRLEEKCCKADLAEYSLLPDAQVLTTHTVPLEEVERHYELWRDAMQSELDSLITEKHALSVVTAQGLEDMQAKGTHVTVVPSKVVFTRKAGGRYKARLVACGNHIEHQRKGDGGNGKQRANLYAGGIDPSILRQVLSFATKQGWSGGCTDIKTAFLNADLLDRANPRTSPPPLSLEVPTEVILLKIPSIVHRHGHLDRSNFLLVQKAVYGLDQSPRDWSIERDREIAAMKVTIDELPHAFEQSKIDSNLWYLREVPTGGQEDLWREPRACMLVYVDDVLVLSPSHLLDRVLGLITGRWDCGKVERIPNSWQQPPLKFFGFELRWEGPNLLLSQRDYIKDMAARYPDAPKAIVPCPPGSLDVEDLEVQNPEDVAFCQSALGEALWIAHRTRPDVVFAVSRLAQLVSRNACEARKWSLQLLGYLIHSHNFHLKYRQEFVKQGQPGATATPDSSNTVEAQTDSAFAPCCERSQECTLVYSQGDLTGWITGRQPFTAASTAESELLSLMSGFCFGRAQIYVLWELLGKEPRLVVVNDNMASISIVNNDSNNWRSRHLRIRAHVLREQARAGALDVVHIEGLKNISDAGTKSLPYPRLALLREGMGLQDCKEKGIQKASAATLPCLTGAATHLKVAALALTVVLADGQPTDSSPQGFNGVLRVLIACCVCLIVGMWVCSNWCLRFAIFSLRGRNSRFREREDAHSSDGEQEPDHEDTLCETSLDQARCSSDPSDQARSSRDPLDQARSSRDPLDQARSSRDPLDQARSSRDPLDQARSSRDPLDQARSSRDPLDQARSTRDPLDQARSSRDPLDQARSSRDPLDQARSTRDPLDQARSSRDPLDQARPSRDPLEQASRSGDSLGQDTSSEDSAEPYRHAEAHFHGDPVVDVPGDGFVGNPQIEQFSWGVRVRYIDDEVLVEPAVGNTPEAGQAPNQELRRRTQGQRIYREEPDGEPRSDSDLRHEAFQRELQTISEFRLYGPLPQVAPSVTPLIHDQQAWDHAFRRGLEAMVSFLALPDTSLPPTQEEERGTGSEEDHQGWRAENGAWVRPFEAVQRAAVARNQRRQGLIRLRPDWPYILIQPEAGYRSIAWGGEASALHQLRPNAQYNQDDWTRPEDRPQVLIRWHMRPRIRLFQPLTANCPVGRERLSGRRRTLVTFLDGSQEYIDDMFTSLTDARRYLRMRWQGRTELELT